MTEQLIEIQGCQVSEGLSMAFGAFIESTASQVSQYLPGNSDTSKTDVPLADGPLALFAANETDSQLKLVCGTAA